MLYLLDSSVLIDANRRYYKLEQVLPFWTWLESEASEGRLKIPDEMYKEVMAGYKGDSLRDWVMKRKVTLLLEENADISLVRRVTNEGYANDLNDEEREKVGNDAFLIAYALADAANRCVVTMEESKPSKKRAERRIPDVCNALGIKCINTFQMLDELGFRVS